METSTVSIEEVRSLVAERQRYDDWLSALEARRDTTPARVYERVEQDYSARRDDVTSRLGKHVEMLRSLRTQLDERLSAADAELADLEDSRAEAMLRTEVGEFDNDRWEQVRRDVESSIEEKSAIRSALSDELNEVRQLLDSATPAPDIEAEVPADEVVIEPAVVAQAAEPSNGAGLDMSAGFLIDELVDVGDLGVDSAEESTFDPADLMSSWDDNGDKVSQVIDGESAFLVEAANGLVNDDVLPVVEGAVTSQASSNAASETFVDSVRPISPEPVGSTSADDSFDDLAFLRSVVDSDSGSAPQRNVTVADQQKTLRCTDCGTMNLPTEWYCERCGGELAAF